MSRTGSHYSQIGYVSCHNHLFAIYIKNSTTTNCLYNLMIIISDCFKHITAWGHLFPYLETFLKKKSSSVTQPLRNLFSRQATYPVHKQGKLFTPNFPNQELHSWNKMEVLPSSHGERLRAWWHCKMTCNNSQLELPVINHNSSEPLWLGRVQYRKYKFYICTSCWVHKRKYLIYL
jgi:hypothetical protein